MSTNQGDKSLLTPRIIRPKSKREISLPVEKGNIATRRIIVVEFDAAVTHGFVVGRVASGGKDGEVVAVEMDLNREALVSLATAQ